MKTTPTTFELGRGLLHDKLSYAATMDEIVEVEVGTDVFGAQIILAACRSEGFQVQLLSFHETGGHPGIAANLGVMHRMLVRSEDLAEVQEIIDDSL